MRRGYNRTGRTSRWICCRVHFVVVKPSSSGQAPLVSPASWPARTADAAWKAPITSGIRAAPGIWAAPGKRVPTATQKLLWACKTALKAIQHQGGGDPRPHGSEEEWDEIEAAIAEAEGRPLPAADDTESEGSR
jgi:hypothetical protein